MLSPLKINLLAGFDYIKKCIGIDFFNIRAYLGILTYRQCYLNINVMIVFFSMQNLNHIYFS